MLKLTLYVIPSGLPNADVEKTINSFTFFHDQLEKEITLISKWHRASTIRDIMKHRKDYDDDWYIILYDNEHISIGLAHSIYTRFFLKMDHDVYICIKKTPGITQSPRLFRNLVKLPEESLLPGKEALNHNNDPLRYDRIMDGWVVEHV